MDAQELDEALRPLVELADRNRDLKRSILRKKARLRVAKSKPHPKARPKVRYARALFLERRSAVLVYLEKAEGEVTAVQVAKATAVPVSVVRDVMRKINRAAGTMRSGHGRTE